MIPKKYYDVAEGCMGLIDENDTYQLFSNYSDYNEWYQEQLKEDTQLSKNDKKN